MAKYRPFSRREFRRRQREWMWQRRWRFVGLMFGVVALLILETVILTVVMHRSAFTWWLLGVVQAVLACCLVFFTHLAFLAHDREAIWHLRGAWGEDNTRTELQRSAGSDQSIMVWPSRRGGRCVPTHSSFGMHGLRALRKTGMGTGEGHAGSGSR